MFFPVKKNQNEHEIWFILPYKSPVPGTACTFMFTYDKVYQIAPQLTFYSIAAIRLLEEARGSDKSECMSNALQN